MRWSRGAFVPMPARRIGGVAVYVPGAGATMAGGSSVLPHGGRVHMYEVDVRRLA